MSFFEGLPGVPNDESPAPQMEDAVCQTTAVSNIDVCRRSVIWPAVSMDRKLMEVDTGNLWCPLRAGKFEPHEPVAMEYRGRASLRADGVR